MVYFTGDTHGSRGKLLCFCDTYRPGPEDTIVILGDAGLNYYGTEDDYQLKRELAKLEPTIFCIHGNHEMRPQTVPSYRQKQWKGGTVWYEPDYPNLLFAEDGEIYDLDGLRCIAIGGAYSVDKYYRIARSMRWFADEQPSQEIKERVEAQLRQHPVDVILSHTCPYSQEPMEAFLTGIDQSQVDSSTEEWLDTIWEKNAFDAWLCGHWHIDKQAGKLRFLMQNFISTEDIRKQ